MITVVAPHPDDAELGASLFLRRGTRILNITGRGPRILEQTQAAAIAGVQTIQPWCTEGYVQGDLALIREIEPHLRESTTVVSPPVADTHQDHRAVALAVRSALRRSAVTLLEYETPSTTPDWEPNVFIPMTDDDLMRQGELLDAFKSQADRPYFDGGWLVARARIHGFRIGETYAQAFRLVHGSSTINFPGEIE